MSVGYPSGVMVRVSCGPANARNLPYTIQLRSPFSTCSKCSYSSTSKFSLSKKLNFIAFASPRRQSSTVRSNVHAHGDASWNGGNGGYTPRNGRYASSGVCERETRRDRENARAPRAEAR